MALAVTVAGCALEDQTKPSFVGPSELGLSLTMSADPDTLQRDGASQALITVIARDERNQVMPNVRLQADIYCRGLEGQFVPADYGTLSMKQIVTGTDGKATMVYTAPPQVGPLFGLCYSTPALITVTPVGTNAANAVVRQVAITLIEPGIIVPPSNLKPQFTYTPSAPVDNDNVLFDASASTGSIASYSWNFGDGSSGSGVTASHRFSAPGQYAVTLTVADSVGRAASTTQAVSVSQGQAPTADFDFSPTPVAVGQTVNFNASKSRAAPGRTIVSYDWDFGDASGGSGVTVSKAYNTAATYTVTLMVTDDAGRRGVTSKSVQVGNGLAAAFTVTPQTGTAPQTVIVDASGSMAPSGRTIVSYGWSFGCVIAAECTASTGTGVSSNTTYVAPRMYTITLTIQDDLGNSATTTRTVDIR